MFSSAKSMRIRWLASAVVLLALVAPPSLPAEDNLPSVEELTAELLENSSSRNEPLSDPALSEAALSDPALSETMSLEPGEIRSLTVHNIQRVAIGDPSIADLTLVSLKEVLLKAVKPGTTNLIIWDQDGKQTWSVEVVDRKPEATEEQIRRLLKELNFFNVFVKRESGRLFLIGQVPTSEDLDRINELLSVYKDQATSLVGVTPKALPSAAGPPQSVKLTVQVIEMTRDASDEIGVDWSDTLTFTETTFGVLGPSGGHSQVARLGEAFRLGALSRNGFSQVVKMLATQGKARILAEPKLVAASGKEATTNIGVEVPIITTTSVSSGTVSQSIEFKKTGVELKFKPTVLENQHSIQLAINAKVSSIDTANAITVSGIVVPGFRIRQTDTEIVTDDGQSVFISGLLQDEERKNLSQLPGLGNIPVLGTLFRSTEFTRGQTELVIVVTPELSTSSPNTPEREFALEQSLTSAETASAVKNPTLQYALQIQDRIAKAIRYPQQQAQAGASGRVTLRLHLFRDGRVDQAVVGESSGVEMFDSEALQAAQRQAPYPPFPSDLIQQDLWLEIPVVFRP